MRSLFLAVLMCGLVVSCGKNGRDGKSGQNGSDGTDLEPITLVELSGTFKAIDEGTEIHTVEFKIESKEIVVDFKSIPDNNCLYLSRISGSPLDGVITNVKLVRVSNYPNNRLCPHATGHSFSFRALTDKEMVFCSIAPKIECAVYTK